ncbi:hypothetical protein FB451DRAFT_1170140 [Mycena latifolia]|nr:hypothetical protein FB451DRAFT_1170140 [Mycena latifolia]
MDLALEDEDVRIAVRALGDMRNGKQSAAFVFPAQKQQQQQQTQNQSDAGESPRMSSASASGSTSHTPALSLSLTSTHPASSPPHTPPLEDDRDDHGPRSASSSGPNNGNGNGNGSGESPTYPSLARMQSLPLVSGALRVYEAGKANSRVVQYTSSLVSTSLRHASSRLPAGSGERIDEFAGGMLDRVSLPPVFFSLPSSLFLRSPSVLVFRPRSG